MPTITDKIDNVTLVTPDRCFSIVKAPLSVKIELTRKCNYKCNFCVNEKLSEKDHMSRDKYSEYIKKVYNAGVRQLGVFYFGESFLVSWLPDAIKEAKDMGFERVFLTTNGSLATPEKVEKCMVSGLDSLKFSMNYADEEQFVEITKMPKKLFSQSIHNLKMAKEIRDKGNFKCGIFASYIQYDGKQGERMRDVIYDIQPYVDELYALPLYTQANSIDNPEWDFVGGNPGRVGNLRPPVPCFCLFNVAHINFDGTMNGCGFGLSEGFRHGNLNETDFMTAWNDINIQRLRQAHLDKKLEGMPCYGCVKRNENLNKK